MFQKSLKFSIVVVVIVSYVTLLFGTGYAAPPTVKLIVNPNKTDVYVGSDPVALTAKATGAGVKFKWELQGPGKIEGTGSAIFYNIPDKIEGESAQAIVTITVTDEAGQEATETFTFNILASKTPEKKEAAPEPAKEGMSRTTKIALGAGAAAALGLGVALAVGGGDDKKDSPFTGTFVREYPSSVNGYLVNNIDTFNLKQNGNSITGTYTSNATLVGCCNATYSVPVTGSADGLSGVLSWGAGEAQCICPEWRYTNRGSAVTNASVVLINDKKILQFEGGAEATRSKVIRIDEFGGDVKESEVIIEGDFIRQ